MKTWCASIPLAVLAILVHVRHGWVMIFPVPAIQQDENLQDPQLFWCEGGVLWAPSSWFIAMCYAGSKCLCRFVRAFHWSTRSSVMSCHHRNINPGGIANTKVVIGKRDSSQWTPFQNRHRNHWNLRNYPEPSRNRYSTKICRTISEPTPPDMPLPQPARNMHQQLHWSFVWAETSRP